MGIFQPSGENSETRYKTARLMRGLCLLLTRRTTCPFGQVLVPDDGYLDIDVVVSYPSGSRMRSDQGIFDREGGDGDAVVADIIEPIAVNVTSI